MKLTFQTLTKWDEELWEQLQSIYHEAFPHGAKPDKLLQRIVDRGIAFLHAGFVDGEAVAMAVTGLTGPTGAKRLVIDYMAVSRKERGKGYGRHFVECIRNFAVQEFQVQAILIEAENEDNETNRKRISFWTGCGFETTSYVHQYIWVPEPYRALVLPIAEGYAVTDDGKSLFKDITSFHEKAYRQR